MYWSSVVYLPTSVLKEIEALCRNFLWHGKEDASSMPLPLVAWQKVCVPRREGGIGIKQLRTWNRAALGRHLWVILTRPANLWSKWVHSNYLKGNNIWMHEFPKDCSWGIRKLMQLRPIFYTSFKCTLGDGRECSLFYDWWMGDGRLCDVESVKA